MNRSASPDDTGVDQASGRWMKGQSGNPAGRPRGSRNRVLLALDQISGEAAEAILRKSIKAARGGDQRAAEMILSRVWPASKSRPVRLDLPPISCAGDVVAAFAAVTRAVADGTITPEEGRALASVLEAQRRAIETCELEGRVAALEGRYAADNR